MHQTHSTLHTVLCAYWAPTCCSKVPPWDGGTHVLGSQADWLSQIIGLFSQPCVTLSRLTDAFLPILGVSYSKANNLRLPLAKPGRKGILQIQKVNSTYSFPNLVNNVYAFTTTECMHSTVLLLSYLLSNYYILAIQFLISKIGVLYLDSHSISNPKSKSYLLFLLSFYSCISSKGTALP